MSINGTVLGVPLSFGEWKEWHASVLQKLPNLPPDRIRHLIQHKGELGELLKALGSGRKSIAEISAEWEQFYLKYFGPEVSFSGIIIPKDPGGFGQLIVVAQGLTLNQVYKACEVTFPCRRLNLGHVVKENERDPKYDAYAIRVRNRQKPDKKLKRRSANWVREQGFTTETLLERLLHELKFFDETGKHLDIRTRTLCSGSCMPDGRIPPRPIPSVGWEDNQLKVFSGTSESEDNRVFAREVIL